MCQELLSRHGNREHLTVCRALRNKHRRMQLNNIYYMQNIPQWILSLNLADVYTFVGFNANPFSLMLQQILGMLDFTREEKLTCDLNHVCESSPSLLQRRGCEETAQVILSNKEKNTVHKSIHETPQTSQKQSEL